MARSVHRSVGLLGAAIGGWEAGRGRDGALTELLGCVKWGVMGADANTTLADDSTGSGAGVGKRA